MRIINQRRMDQPNVQGSQLHSTRALLDQHENTDTAIHARRGKRIRLGNDSHSSQGHLNDINIEVTENAGHPVEVKTRGPTNMPRVWARREQVEVEFNALGKPIGKNKSEYVEFIGTLVRNGDLLPLDYENWHKVPMSLKKNLFKLIEEKFTGPYDFKDVAWEAVAKGWRNWKNRVKKNYFDPNSSLEENLRKRPNTTDERVNPDQWKNLVIYWSSDIGRKTSAQNTNNRAQKKMMHITGKKSFSQVRDEMKKERRALKHAERDNDEETEDVEESDDHSIDDEPSRMDMFGKCFTENGESSNPIVADTWRRMQEKKSELAPNSKDDGPNDIFSQVAGEDKWGRVKMWGYGITTSDIYGDIPSKGRSSRMRMN